MESFGDIFTAIFVQFESSNKFSKEGKAWATTWLEHKFNFESLML